MTEPRQCPFCGSRAEVQDWYCGDSKIPYYRVRCENDHSLDRWDDTPEEAIDAWNQRV